MHSKDHHHNYAQLNDHIKTDLLASQRFLSDHEKVQTEVHNSGAYKPSSIKIRDRINFFEVIQPHADLTDQEITSALERWLVMMRYHRIILLFNDNATDIREHINGNETIKPPTTAMVMLDMKVPLTEFTCRFSFIGGMQSESPMPKK